MILIDNQAKTVHCPMFSACPSYMELLGFTPSRILARLLLSDISTQEVCTCKYKLRLKGVSVEKNLG